MAVNHIASGAPRDGVTLLYDEMRYAMARLSRVTDHPSSLRQTGRCGDRAASL